MAKWTIRLSSLLLLVAGHAHPAPGATWTDELVRCQAIADSLDRLGCFDGLTLGDGKVGQSTSGPATAPTYRRLTIAEFQLDATALKGRKVELTGVVQQLGKLVLLKNSLFDANVLFVEIEKAPRDDRRRLFEHCGKGCTATVRGTVGSVMMQDGIIAETIEVF